MFLLLFLLSCGMSAILLQDEDFATCKEENNHLRDIIEDVIKDVKQLTDQVSVLSSSVALNTKHIQDSQDQMSTVSTNLTESIDFISENLNTIVYDNICAIYELKSNGN